MRLEIPTVNPKITHSNHRQIQAGSVQDEDKTRRPDSEVDSDGENLIFQVLKRHISSICITI